MLIRQCIVILKVWNSQKNLANIDVLPHKQSFIDHLFIKVQFKGGAFANQAKHQFKVEHFHTMIDICWIQHIRNRFGNYVGSNVKCEIFIKAIGYKKNKWKGSETNIWSRIGLQSYPTLALHHMSSNSFAIPRLNKSKIAL